MPYCSVKWCGKCSTTSSFTKDGITFHRFPKCHVVKKKWINATKRDDNWFPGKNNVICSRHFTEDCFRLVSGNRRFLFETAVPTLMLPCWSSENPTEASTLSKPVTADQKIITPATQSVSSVHGICISLTDSVQNTLNMPSTSAESETVNQDTFRLVPQQNTDFDSLVSIPSTYSTPRKRRLYRAVIDLSQRVKKKNVALKRLRDSNRKLKRKVDSLEQLLGELKKKQMISDENSSILASIGLQNKEIIKRQVMNATSGKISRMKYSPALRTFALTLNFYSAKAYQYVRSTFNTCLPSKQTLSKWYKTIDGRPGFTKEAFQAIKLRSEQAKASLYGTLIFDEMKIKNKVEFVPSTRRTFGYVDFGTDINSNCNDECTDALVFLVVPFNGMFKVPIGYFLINKVTADQKANLVCQAIQMCSEVNFVVKAVTFDGCPTNISMAKKLGCNLDPSNLKTTFTTNNSEIAIFLDPVHMIKLVRNSFEYYYEFCDSHSNSIKWSYIQKLHKFQETESFHMANKLRAQHLNFKTNIMKVKLATQLFSRSVATALTFCNTKLHIQEFKDVTATANMIMLLNDLFDILDSKTHGYGLKRAMNQENYPVILEKMEAAKSFLLGLKTPILDKKAGKIKYVNLIHSPRYTGFIGLCICIESAKFLFKNVIENESCPLHYLPLHKISQDHIELFFCNIRSSGGANNNPTPRLFEAIYKKILIHTEIRPSASGNCIPLENISILNCSSAIDRLNISTTRTETTDEDPQSETDENFIQALQHITLSLFSENIIEYIAGSVANSLLKKIKCNKCITALISLPEKKNSLIYARDRGGLIYPSDSVIKICRRCEVIIRMNDLEKIKQRCRPMYFSAKTLNSLSNDELFPDLLQHQFDFEIVNHLIDLIKCVIDKYIVIRLAYLTKKTETKSIRRVYTKLIHFKGQ